ncbi:MAG: T9SS type A sorting domain-containing protein [Chitinophagales bacterium]|nr:T9SS type A sorting domain-containing protein [Chitinophagales bacterium]MDW8393032.1 T9SS type A sorting domain-containing protein [Chitinophagales bacterium]
MKQKNTRLLGRLKQYSALTVPLVAGAGLANGQVVYTDINPDVEIELGESFDLDLNNDGNVDFKLKVATYGPDWYRAALAPYPYYTTNQNAFAGYVNTLGGLLKLGYVSAIPQGNAIDANNDWKVLNDLVFSYNANAYFLFAAMLSTYMGGVYGQWGGGITDHSIALRFSPDGTNLHYGWLRCEVTPDARKITLKDYAFEATAGASIQAGVVVSAPQPQADPFRIFGFEGTVHVMTEKPQGATLRITNMLGQVVHSQDLTAKHTTVNLNSKGKGTYLVSVTQDNSVTSKKVSFR